MNATQLNPSSNAAYNKSLLSTGAFSDCRIHCKSRTWDVHRAILLPRCTFFKACLAGFFSESLSDSKEVHMDDDEPETLEGLLHYLYTLEYPYESSQNLDQAMDAQSFWNSDLSLYLIADKYNLPDLMSLANSALMSKAAAISDPSNDEHTTTFLKLVDGFVNLVHALYPEDKMTADALQAIRGELLTAVAGMTAYHIRDERLSGLIAEVPEFGVDLLFTLGRKIRQTVEVGGITSLASPHVGNKGISQRVYIPMNEDSDLED